jgi:PAS domain S-box-containing protein
MTRHSEEGPDEVRRLQACLDDLVSGMAPSAPWSGGGSSAIVAALLDGLVRMLRLEFAYARLVQGFDDTPTEAIRPSGSAAGGLHLDAASAAFREWQAEPGAGPRRVPIPGGEGSVWIAMAPLGNLAGIGALMVGAARPGFPSAAETLILQIAANQAAIGLQEARRRADERRAARTLEERVAERTCELSAINAQLRREITERRRAEEERLMLAALVENSTDFIGLASLDGQVLFVNPAGQAITGIEGDEEARSLRVFDFVVEQDRRHVHEQVWPAVLKEGRWDGELRFANLRTGVTFAMHTHVFMVNDPRTGERVATATISRDITQRKRAEAELLALKDQLAGELTAMTRLHDLSTRLQAMSELPQILDAVLLAIMSLQEADCGLVHLVNAETGALEVVARRGFDAASAAHSPAMDLRGTAYARALAQRSRVIVEDVQSAPGCAGADRALGAAAGFRALQSTPLLDDSGAGLGTISTHFRRPHRPTLHQLRFTDLYARQAAERTARHRVETALKRSEAYLAEGQKISHTGSWAWHRRTGELFWSLEHYRIFGIDPARAPLSQADFLRMVHPEDRAFVQAMLDEGVAQGGEFDCEYRLVRPDGSVRYLHSRGHPLEDGGEILVGSVVDETERKRAEAALARAREELVHVARVTTMGELTASIAHEVNQPLAAVVTNANACLHWLAAQPANMEEAHSAAQRIIRDANRASEVITRIRTFLTRGKPMHTALHIDEVIREVIGMVQGEARAKGVSLVVVPGPRLPRVLGDRVQLEQVVLNLAMNAIEAMSTVKGGPRLLEISALREGGEVRVTVRDTGPGLDAAQREKVFDAFYTTKPHGMGMGLAISRSIVESHGGRLWATRNCGDGETFQFTLPVEDEVTA